MLTVFLVIGLTHDEGFDVTLHSTDNAHPGQPLLPVVVAVLLGADRVDLAELIEGPRWNQVETDLVGVVLAPTLHFFRPGIFRQGTRRFTSTRLRRRRRSTKVMCSL